MNQLFPTSTNNVCVSMDVCEKFLEWQSMRFLLAFTRVGTVAIRRLSHAIDALLLVCARAQISQYS